MLLLWNTSFLTASYVYIVSAYIWMKIPWYQAVAIILRSSFQKCYLSIMHRKMFLFVCFLFFSFYSSGFPRKRLVNHPLYCIAFPKFALSQIFLTLFTPNSLAARVLRAPTQVFLHHCSHSEWMHFYPFDLSNWKLQICFIVSLTQPHSNLHLLYKELHCSFWYDSREILLIYFIFLH